MYEYTAVEVPVRSSFKVNVGDSFKQCMDVINKYAEDDWRLVQIVLPPNEKAGVMMPYAYEIIFEKEIKR